MTGTHLRLPRRIILLTGIILNTDQHNKKERGDIMPENASGSNPGDMKRIDGVIKVALVGFDKNGDTCLKWYIPKVSKDIHKARRLQTEGKI